MLKVKIAAGRASDHDRAVADRQDLVSPFVIESKATNDAVIALQSRTPCVVQRVTGLRARRPPFLSAILARRSRDHSQGTQDPDSTRAGSNFETSRSRGDRGRADHGKRGAREVRCR